MCPNCEKFCKTDAWYSSKYQYHERKKPGHILRLKEIKETWYLKEINR